MNNYCNPRLKRQNNETIFDLPADIAAPIVVQHGKHPAALCVPREGGNLKRMKKQLARQPQ
jgi:hypothetical protein